MGFCWLEDAGRHVAKKWEPQSHNCKKPNSANRLKESHLGIKSPAQLTLTSTLFPEQRTQQGHTVPELLPNDCETIPRCGLAHPVEVICYSSHRQLTQQSKIRKIRMTSSFKLNVVHIKNSPNL